MVKVETKWFGNIEIEDEKIITFEKGMIGFEDCKRYTLIFEEEKGNDTPIIWLQSIEEPALAIPIMKPEIVMPEYDPVVEDELIYGLGEKDNVKDAEFMVFVTLTVPQDLTKMTCNLKAPIIINADTMRAIQLIADNDEYDVSHPIYEYLKEKSEKSGKDGE